MKILCTAAAALLLAGCAGTSSNDPGAPPVSSAPPPSAPASTGPTQPTDGLPSGLPKTPTDIVRTAGWVTGTVSRGGSGPCYGVVDEDGVTYALYSDAGLDLAQGARVRAKVSPATLRINCGEGKPVQATSIEKLP